MKNLIISIFLFVVTLGLSSCFEDKGNYEYSDEEIITVKGLENVYNIEPKVQLTIPVTVESSQSAEWEYEWGYIERKGNTYIFHEVGRDKDLSYVFEIPPQTVTLQFSAHNKLTGLKKIVTSTLNLITPYSNGWYVLKDDGTNSDFNLYPVNEGILPLDKSNPRENVLAYVNGKGLNGLAKKFQLNNRFGLLDDEGKFTGTRSIAVITDRDLGIYRASNLIRERDLSNISFVPWQDVEPTLYYSFGSAEFLVSDGKAYVVILVAPNTGRFGNQKAIGENEYNYSLSNYYVFSKKISIGFDEISSSFIATGYYGDLQYCTSTSTTEIQAKNNNLTCLYMGHSNQSGVGVFADKTTGEQKVLKTNLAIATDIKIVATLDDEDKLKDAPIITVSNNDDILFFVDKLGGDVWSRRLNEVGTESKEFDVPADETVTFIRQIRHNVKNDSILSFDYIAVATVKGVGVGSTYTIRFFSKLGGNFSEENTDLRLTGKGRAADVNFITPTLDSRDTYYQYIYL